MGIFICVFGTFAAALIAPAVYRLAGRATGWLLALVPAAVFGYLAGHIGSEAAIRVSYPWVPAAGVELSMMLDGLSLFFALLVSGVAAVVLAYSSDYIQGEPFAGRFYAYMMLFAGAMLGLVLADDVIAFYVFFELTSVASFLLIGLDGGSAEARRASRQALIITSAGGFALLAGVLLLGDAAVTFALSDIVDRGNVVRASPHYMWILVLIAAGAFTKSAQMPFHVWLPNAMVAPTPVSAFLHAAAMVKAGIYVLARLHPVLGGTRLWMVLLAVVGGVTMLCAGWLALRQTDLKRMLAYATIMALGMMILLLGLGTEKALEACLVYVLVHALYKAALFMTAGALQHHTGTRDLTELRGLRRSFPATFAVAVVAALSMAGVPAFVGAVGKELVYGAVLEEHLLLAAAVLANIALVAVAAAVAVRPFFGRTTHEHPPDEPRVSSLWIAPALLAAAGLLFGLQPNLFDAPLISAAVSGTLGEQKHVELHTWKGFTPEFLLGMFTIAAGAAVYALLRRVRNSPPLRWLSAALGAGPDRLYDAAQRAAAGAATRATRTLQSGLLRRYLLLTFSAAAVLIGGSIVLRTVAIPQPDLSGIRFHEWVIVTTIVAAAVAAIRARSRLAVILLLSTVSYGIALIYLLAGAPDLALTQLLVETLLTILVVLAFVDLPGLEPISTRRSQAVDAVIAVACGVTVTLIMLTVAAVPFDRSVIEFYTTNSYVLAHGRNIVNTILVDFRALDTMVEVTVLGVAGVSIYVLLWRRQGTEAHRMDEEVEP